MNKRTWTQRLLSALLALTLLVGMLPAGALHVHAEELTPVWECVFDGKITGYEKVDFNDIPNKTNVIIISKGKMLVANGGTLDAIEVSPTEINGMYVFGTVTPKMWTLTVAPQNWGNSNYFNCKYSQDGGKYFLNDPDNQSDFALSENGDLDLENKDGVIIDQKLSGRPAVELYALSDTTVQGTPVYVGLFAKDYTYTVANYNSNVLDTIKSECYVYVDNNETHDDEFEAIYLNDAERVKCTLYYEDGSVVSSIDKVGEYQLQISVDGYYLSKTIGITIEAPKIELTMTPDKLNMLKNETATITPSVSITVDGEEIEDADVDYLVVPSSTNIAAVWDKETGLITVTSYSPGNEVVTTTLTQLTVNGLTVPVQDVPAATSGVGVYANASLILEADKAELSLEKTTSPTGQAALTISTVPSDYTAEAVTYTVVSSDPSVATAEVANGILTVTGQAKGKATITVTAGADLKKGETAVTGVTSEAVTVEVTVADIASEPVNIRLSEPKALLYGKSHQISLAGITQGGVDLTATGKITACTTTSDLVSVTDSGRITAGSVSGLATINVTVTYRDYANVEKTATIPYSVYVVSERSPYGLEIGADHGVYVGTEFTIVPAVDLTEYLSSYTIRWEVSDSSIVTLTGDGTDANGKVLTYGGPMEENAAGYIPVGDGKLELKANAVGTTTLTAYLVSVDNQEVIGVFDTLTIDVTNTKKELDAGDFFSAYVGSDYQIINGNMANRFYDRETVAELLSNGTYELRIKDAHTFLPDTNGLDARVIAVQGDNHIDFSNVVVNVYDTTTGQLVLDKDTLLPVEIPTGMLSFYNVETANVGWQQIRVTYRDYYRADLDEGKGGDLYLYEEHTTGGNGQEGYVWMYVQEALSESRTVEVTTSSGEKVKVTFQLTDIRPWIGESKGGNGLVTMQMENTANITPIFGQEDNGNSAAGDDLLNFIVSFEYNGEKVVYMNGANNEPEWEDGVTSIWGNAGFTTEVTGAILKTEAGSTVTDRIHAAENCVDEYPVTGSYSVTFTSVNIGGTTYTLEEPFTLSVPIIVREDSVTVNKGVTYGLLEDNSWGGNEGYNYLSVMGAGPTLGGANITAYANTYGSDLTEDRFLVGIRPGSFGWTANGTWHEEFRVDAPLGTSMVFPYLHSMTRLNGTVIILDEGEREGGADYLLEVDPEMLILTAKGFTKEGYSNTGEIWATVTDKQGNRITERCEIKWTMHNTTYATTEDITTVGVNDPVWTEENVENGRTKDHTAYGQSAGVTYYTAQLMSVGGKNVEKQNIADYCIIYVIDGTMELSPVDVVIDYGKPIEIGSDLLLTETGYEIAGFADTEHPMRKHAITDYGHVDLDADEEGIPHIVYTPTAIVQNVETVYCIVQKIGTNNQWKFHTIHIIPATIVYYETDFADGVFHYSGLPGCVTCSYGEWNVLQQATCCEAGLQSRTCSVCGFVQTETIPVDLTKHQYGEGVVTQPTCTADGYTTYTCTVCQGSYQADVVSAVGHSWSSNNCEETRTCTQCGATAEAGSHSWDAGTVTTAATCTVNGVKTFTCGSCNATKTEEIQAAGHSPVTDAAVAATCTTDGKTEGSHCSVCNTILVAQETVTATGHSYATVVTAPTCTAQGYSTHTCSVCGSSYQDNWVAATGHSYENGTCTVCGTAESHTHSYETVVTAPTCTQQGYTTYTCTCGSTYTSDYVNATGHSYTSEVTAPTCTEKGFTTYTCACGDSYISDETAATGHNWTWELSGNVYAKTCTCGLSQTAATLPEDAEAIYGLSYDGNTGVIDTQWNSSGQVFTTQYGGPIDTTVIREGTELYVAYTGSQNAVKLIMQPVSGSDWGWKEVTANSCVQSNDGWLCTFSYDAIRNAYGSEDFSALGCIMVQMCVADTVEITGIAYKPVTAEDTASVETFLAYAVGVAEDESDAEQSSGGVWSIVGNEAQNADRQDEYVPGSDLYGNDSHYADTYDTGLSDGTSWFVNGTTTMEEIKAGDPSTYVNFTFTGTGFDIISRTNANQGTIRVWVYAATDTAHSNPLRNVSVINKGVGELYQIPVVSVEGLEHGVYDVVIAVYDAVNYGSVLSIGNEFYFDAIRVYGTINTDATTTQAAIAANAYKNDKEYDPEFIELGQHLIENAPAGNDKILGVIYLDDPNGETTDSYQKYDKIGANNEIYLENNNGVAFLITVDEKPDSIHIGAKSILGATVTMSVTGYSAAPSEGVWKTNGTSQTIQTCTQQYYDMTSTLQSVFVQNGNKWQAYIVIWNSGDSVLSLTDLKLAYGDNVQSVSELAVTNQAYTLGMRTIARANNYDIVSAAFTEDSVKTGDETQLTVITTQDVVRLEVTDENGNAVESHSLYVDTATGDRVWTVTLNPIALGEQTFTVTGYNAESEAGRSVNATVMVTL